MVCSVGGVGVVWSWSRSSGSRSLSFVSIFILISCLKEIVRFSSKCSLLRNKSLKNDFHII